MMWLVIAALLLAAALQGIGYYQKASYLYSMKNDASNAGSSVMAQVANDGKITDAAVTAGTNETKKTTNIDTVNETGASDAAGFVIRSTSPSVEDQDVVFLSKQRGTYAPGIHIVPKGTVIAPDGGTTIVTPPAGGSGGGSVELVSNPSNVVATPQVISFMTKYAAKEALPLNIEVADLERQNDAVGWNDAALEDQYDAVWDEFIATDEYKAYIADRYNNAIWLDYQNLVTDPRVTTEKAEYERLSSIFYETSATAETQKAMIDAQNTLYKAAIGLTRTTSYNFVAAPSRESDFMDKSAVGGTNTPVTFTVAMPDGTTANNTVTGSLYRSPSSPYTWAGGVTVNTFVENGTTYWTTNVVPSGGWVSGQTYDFSIYEQAAYGQPADAYWKTFKITVP